MTKEGKFLPFEFTAIKTVTVDETDKVGIVAFRNTGDEDIDITAMTTSNTAITTVASTPTTLAFEQTFVDGTVYYKDTDGRLTTDSTQTGIQIGTGTANNTLYINVYKAPCLNRMENQVELYLTGSAYEENILYTVPCLETLKIKRGRNLFLTGN